jgi:hypothetical protein
MRRFHHRHQPFLRFIDTQRKWLLLHLIVDSCARTGSDYGWRGAATNRIADRATAMGIASRNTTLAFFSQLAAYGHIDRHDCHTDRRIRLVSLSAGTQVVLADWAAMLIESLGLAGEDDAEIAWLLYLDIARLLLDRPDYIDPPRDIGLIQDMRGGWLVMSDMLSRIAPADAGLAAIPIHGLSAPRCARQYGLSKSTVYRLLRQAADAGIIEPGTPAPAFRLSGDHFSRYCRWNGLLMEAVRAVCNRAAIRRAVIPAEPVAIALHKQADIRAPATSFL